jgi:hypothetical protein
MAEKNARNPVNIQKRGKRELDGVREKKIKAIL